MAIQDRDRPLRSLVSALVIVAVAYAANAFFNHTAWGLAMKSQGDVYVFAFFLLVGVIVPTAYIGWAASIGLASPRWLGASVGWRDAAAASIALAVGGLLAVAALAPHLSEPSGTLVTHRLFALLLVASTAEVLLFLGVLGNAVQLAMSAAGRWRAGVVTIVVSSVVFGFFHLTYPTPWNTLSRALGLTLVWVPVSLLFLVSRSLLGAVVLNNLMAVLGFVTNRIELRGSAAAGWLQEAVACALFVIVFRLTRRWQRAA